MSNSALFMEDQEADHKVITSGNNYVGDRFDDILNFIENKVINADGLTLAEVFQALVQMLNGDLELVKKVLAHANIMAKYGMKVAEESRLSRADVRRILEGKESTISIEDFMKKPSSTPSVKETKKKKGKGI